MGGCGYDKRNNHVSDVYYRYAQLVANNTDRKMDFYNKEIYQIDIGNWRELRIISDFPYKKEIYSQGNHLYVGREKTNFIRNRNFYKKKLKFIFT